MIAFKPLAKTTRPRFLLLTPTCIFLGFCVAVFCNHQIQHIDLVEAFMVGLLAHISVNTLNEFFDFRSGLDLVTTKTAFTGGSGALPANPSADRAVLAVAIGTLVASVLVGLHIASRHGPIVWPIGILGIALVVSYTPWLNRLPYLCLIAPGTAFGPLMVGGTYVALAGQFAFLPFYVSLVPFFLVNNLLLLNQLPDISADKSVGREHLAIRYGVATAVKTHGAFTICAFAVIAFGIAADILPSASLLTYIPMLGSVAANFGAKRFANSTEHLLPYLGANVISAILSPAVLGLSIVYA